MPSNSCTFIIVPDAASECKRYSISKSVLCIVGIIGVVLLFVLGVVLYTLLSEYETMSMKVEQLERLEKASLSQKSTIDRYEQDITQLSKHLSQIKHLNSRLMILSGLDPREDTSNLGLGGSEEEIESGIDTQKSKGGASK
jgi:hypothetical protein